MLRIHIATDLGGEIELLSGSDNLVFIPADPSSPFPDLAATTSGHKPRELPMPVQLVRERMYSPIQQLTAVHLPIQYNDGACIGLKISDYSGLEPASGGTISGWYILGPRKGFNRDIQDGQDRIIEKYPERQPR